MVYQKATSEGPRGRSPAGPAFKMISQTAVLLANRSTGPEAASIADLAEDLTNLADKLEALGPASEYDV